MGRPAAGPAARRLRAAPRRRPAVHVAPWHGLRVLEPRLRDPRSRRHGGRRRRVPRVRARPDPRPDGHDIDRLPRRGRARRAARGWLHAPGGRAHPRGRRRVRGAGVDGRRVLDRSRPRPLGLGVRGRVPRPGRPGGRPSTAAVVPPGDAAGPSIDPAVPSGAPGPRGAGRDGRGLRLRSRRHVRHRARDGHPALRRVSGVRGAHDLAPRDRPWADRPGQPALRAVPAGRGRAAPRARARGRRAAPTGPVRRAPSGRSAWRWRACSSPGTTRSPTRRSR